MTTTYNTLGTVAPGDVLRANSGTASYNGIITNVNNYRKPPMCRVRRASSNQSFTAGSSTYIQWNNTTAEVDTEAPSDPMWSSGDNTKVTVRTAGMYQVTMSFYMSWSGAATNWFIELIKTDAAGTVTTAIGADYLFKQATNDFIFQRIATIAGASPCAVGDYFRVRLAEFGGGTSPAIVNSEYTSLTVAWLGQVS